MQNATASLRICSRTPASTDAEAAYFLTSCAGVCLGMSVTLACFRFVLPMLAVKVATIVASLYFMQLVLGGSAATVVASVYARQLRRPRLLLAAVSVYFPFLFSLLRFTRLGGTYQTFFGLISAGLIFLLIRFACPRPKTTAAVSGDAVAPPPNTSSNRSVPLLLLRDSFAWCVFIAMLVPYPLTTVYRRSICIACRFASVLLYIRLAQDCCLCSTSFLSTAWDRVLSSPSC